MEGGEEDSGNVMHRRETSHRQQRQDNPRKGINLSIFRKEDEKLLRKLPTVTQSIVMHC